MKRIVAPLLGLMVLLVMLSVILLRDHRGTSADAPPATALTPSAVAFATAPPFGTVGTGPVAMPPPPPAVVATPPARPPQTVSRQEVLDRARQGILQIDRIDAKMITVGDRQRLTGTGITDPASDSEERIWAVAIGGDVGDVYRGPMTPAQPHAWIVYYFRADTGELFAVSMGPHGPQGTWPPNWDELQDRDD